VLLYKCIFITIHQAVFMRLKLIVRGTLDDHILFLSDQLRICAQSIKTEEVIGAICGRNGRNLGCEQRGTQHNFMYPRPNDLPFVSYAGESSTMSNATTFRPCKDCMILRNSREVQPPDSGVPADMNRHTFSFCSSLHPN
jgi:hypothetical protein